MTCDLGEPEDGGAIGRDREKKRTRSGGDLIRTCRHRVACWTPKRRRPAGNRAPGFAAQQGCAGLTAARTAAGSSQARAAAHRKETERQKQEARGGRLGNAALQGSEEDDA